MKTKPGLLIKSHGMDFLLAHKDYSDRALIANELVDVFSNETSQKTLMGPVFLVDVEHGSLPQTLHKTFNRQTNTVTSGNVCANTMIGNYIRPETELNSENKADALRQFDLERFRSFPDAYKRFTRFLTNSDMAEELKHESLIGYCFFTYSGTQSRPQRNDLGWLLVRARDRKVVLCSDFMNEKAESVMQYARKQLTDEGIASRTKIATNTPTGLVIHHAEIWQHLQAMASANRFVFNPEIPE